MWCWVCSGVVKRVWVVRGKSGCGGACVCAEGLVFVL